MIGCTVIKQTPVGGEAQKITDEMKMRPLARRSRSRPPPTSDECQPASSAPLSLVRRVIRPIQCSAALAAVKTHLGKTSHSFPVGSSSFLHTKDSRLRERNLPTSHTDRLPTNRRVVWTVHSTSWVILTYDVMSLPINTVILTWQHALQEKYTRH